MEVAEGERAAGDSYYFPGAVRHGFRVPRGGPPVLGIHVVVAPEELGGDALKGETARSAVEALFPRAASARNLRVGS